MQRFMRAAIGTHNIDNCSRVCHSPTSFALRKSFGLSGATGSFDDFERADVALLVGVNPTQGHPVVGARIKQAALKGAEADHRRPAPDRAVRLRPDPPADAPGHQRRAAERPVPRGHPRRADRRGVHRRAHRGLRGAFAELVARLHAGGGRGDHRRPGGRHRGRRAHVRAGRPRVHRVGPGRDRAPVRLRGRAADLQPGAADRQRRQARRRAAAAARAEQRPGILRPRRAAGHLHRLQAGHRRRGHVEVRAALGRDDEARARHEDPRDVRRRRRGLAEGDVHLRRGRGPDGPEHRARGEGARARWTSWSARTSSRTRPPSSPT